MYTYIAVLFVLLAHHYYIHDELDGFDRVFQVKDVFKIDSHEFWETILLVVIVLRQIRH